MRPRDKEERKVEKSVFINLEPGSLFVIGPETNKLYKHRIAKTTKLIGPRINLTYRTIMPRRMPSDPLPPLDDKPDSDFEQDDLDGSGDENE